MDYGKREAGGPIWILYSHNPLISDLGYFITRDFFKSFLVCKDPFNCKDPFLILTANETLKKSCRLCCVVQEYYRYQYQELLSTERAFYHTV